MAQHVRGLEDYPRPSVAVDTAVLTVAEGSLCVMLLRETGKDPWRLPGTFVHPGERLVDAATRALREKAGVSSIHPRQLHVFDAPDRDDRGWVMSVAHYDVLPVASLASDRVELMPVVALPALVYDHAQIVAFAVDAVREAYRGSPDPSHLLEEPFTMRRLRRLHEAVLGRRLLPDTFRRSMLPGLVATGELFTEGRGRPAELYRRA
jgi:ADP-ribose pyrophosphatase YjhB (NUDIX family)